MLKFIVIPVNKAFTPEEVLQLFRGLTGNRSSSVYVIVPSDLEKSTLISHGIHETNIFTLDYGPAEETIRLHEDVNKTKAKEIIYF